MRFVLFKQVWLSFCLSVYIVSVYPFKAILILQKTWIKPLDSYGFILPSIYECFEFWVNRLSMEGQKSLRFN